MWNVDVDMDVDTDMDMDWDDSRIGEVGFSTKKFVFTFTLIPFEINEH
jgi:hypothetical protein